MNLFGSRALLEPEHDAFRETVRTFLARHVVDHAAAWDEARRVPREPWLEAGRQGLLGAAIPEELGGAGVDDFRFRVVMIEEQARVGVTGVGNGFSTHTDVVIPYFLDLCTPEQAKEWLPGLADGTAVGAIAMTEPGTGSDLRAIRTTARADGDDWVLDGAKTFISNGMVADLVVVAARTEEGVSLFVVEGDRSGLTRSQLRKVGLHGQDTAELHFDGARIPREHLLGTEGRGLSHLMANLPTERMSIAATGVASAKACLAWTLDHVTTREAFGQPIAGFQNTQFELADVLVEVEVAEAYLDAAVTRLGRGELSAVDAAKAKLWCTEMHNRVADRCLQLFGGYGFMEEYPISRSFVDARVTTIYGGTSEIMRLIVARDLLGAR